MDNTTNGTFNGTFPNGTFANGTSFNGTSDLPPQPPKPFWTNLLLPTIYLFVLIGSLYTFSSLYRKRQATKATRLAPWFPPHRQRDVYFSLLHLDPEEASDNGGEKKLSKVPQSVLKAALLRRAVEDIRRLMHLRTSKPALQNLMQRGSVGEEMWQRFLRAEQEMEAELKDVVEEANSYSPGWAQTIFQSANEIYQNDMIKQRVTFIEESLEPDQKWWASKKAGIQSEFMKELDQEAADKTTTTSKKNGSSDDDAVLVDATGPESAQGAQQRGKK